MLVIAFVGKEGSRMRRFKEKLYRFMYGRYGFDDLHKFLLFTVCFLMVAELMVSRLLPECTAVLIAGAFLSMLILALYVWILFRAMSRSILKRRKENEIYLKASRFVKRCLTLNTSRKTRSRNLDDAMYIFRDCPKCTATLRLPRNPGKHSVKCPKCAHSFYVVSK